jgi:predicted nucleic acid-binding protein
VSRFLDTNVLLYSISTAAAEGRKRDIAVACLAEAHNVLSVQVLQEFYVQSTRPTRQDALPHELAVGLLEAWLRFPVIQTSLALLGETLSLRARYGWSYWDAAVVAAARQAGCDELWTEDLQNGQRVGGLLIVNPFA